MSGMHWVHDNRKAIVNERDASGRSALILAARSGADSLIDALCESGADLTVRGTDGRSAVMWAAANGHERVLKKLLAKAGDGKKGLLQVQDESKCTAGMLAALRYRVKAATLAGYDEDSSLAAYGIAPKPSEDSLHSAEQHTAVHEQLLRQRHDALEQKRRELEGKLDGLNHHYIAAMCVSRWFCARRVAISARRSAALAVSVMSKSEA